MSKASAPRSPRMAVVGAGPAGLVAAIVARRLGLDVTLYEQAPNFGRAGGGVLIHSNGQRVLDALGLLASFEPKMRMTTRFAIEIPARRFRSTTDLSTLPIPFARGAVVLRADLQEHLLAAALREGIPVQFGRRIEGTVREPEGVVLRTARGPDEVFDAVVASDGVHSAVRTSLHLPARERATGEAYIRAVAERRSDDDTVRELWGDDGR
ncbi:MAG: FAD-dependent oxidoreductase, partial [Polyangiaceae bacterium]